MDCIQAKDRLLNADIVGLETGDPDLDAHLQTCSACQVMLASLRRLEAAARALPTVPDAAATRQAFLKLLAPAPPLAERRSALRDRFLSFPRALASSGRRLAMAASILLASGLVFWLVWFQGVQKAAASDALVGNLVDWDVRLGAVDSPEERQKIYTSEAPSLQNSVRDLPVKAMDQALAQKLLQTGSSLTQSVDSLDDAERFADVADLLLDQINLAASAGKTADVERLSRHYAEVTTEGLAKKMAEARPSGNSKAHHAKLEHLSRREHNLQSRIEKLLEESPEPAREKIRRALKSALHKHHT